MKSFIHSFTPFLGMLTLCILLTFSASAQKETGKEKSSQEKSKEDGTIRLRIEKFENGEKKVYERTYKENELDGHSFPDGFMFQQGDSTDTFDFFGNNLFDSIRVLNPSGKIFFDSLENDFSGKQLFFNFDMDSLLNHSGNMFYHFDHSLMPDIDSLLRKSFDASGFLFENLQDNFQFHIDTLLNKRFEFNWDGKNFPFNSGDMNLLLDKDQYEIEEIEKDGKTMLRITPKKSLKDQDKLTPYKNQENFPTSMQPSAASLNLIVERSTGMVNLRFQVPSDGLTIITVTNAKGKQVYKQKVKNKAGVFASNIDLRKNGTGEFTVNVLHNGKKISQKVTIH